MLTFIHLSDIHFSKRNDEGQFDIDQQIRRAVSDDIESKPANGAAYDGLLLTGDIGFAGKIDDYERAEQWLDEIFARAGVDPTTTFCVPGNHDVDRAFVDPALPLWDSHVRLRGSNDPVVWRDIIDKQLHRDPLHTLLAPLTAYNGFAQRYACRTEATQLSWESTFPRPFSDGSLLRLHGLNSVLISDEADAPGKLLVSEFQTAQFTRTAGVTDMVLCHHPPEWLMDKNSVRNAIRAFAPVALFGHEHSSRLTSDAKQLQLFAGAVQPPRRDPGWLPTYHIIQLDVAGRDSNRKLSITIHTREYDSENYRFRPRRNEYDEPAEKTEIAIPAWTAPSKDGMIVSVGKEGRTAESEGDSVASADASAAVAEAAKRELLVHFFRLGTPLRYTTAFEAGLLRDGDDALPPQTMWAEVFRRAAAEDVLAKFWDVVAAKAPGLKEKANPFRK